jgi:predicted CXXCH cytochrome family protein
MEEMANTSWEFDGENAPDLRVFLAGMLLIVVVAIFPDIARGGDWHVGGSLVCSDCHTLHDSSDGQPMRYDKQATPSVSLLRNANPLSLCISCHDGSNQKAPDVIAPVTYVSDPPGGFFANTGGIASGNAHNLGMASSEIPPGGDNSVIMTCTTCHDPHGNSNYRNLLHKPGGAGNVPDMTVAVNQTVKANGSNPSTVYTPSNLVYKSGMSQWCGACHAVFFGKSADKEGIASPWLRHPSDRTISTDKHADYQHWSGSVTNRVPVQSPGDDTIPSGDDQVFCLSCHKAHGSSKPFGLIYADGATLPSTCQQCHSQGRSVSGISPAAIAPALSFRH